MERMRLIVFFLFGSIFAASAAAAQEQGRRGDVPAELDLPVGTLITVRTEAPLSSDRNMPGETFTTVLEQPIVAKGWVVARRGQTAIGRVVAAQSASGKNDSSTLLIELSELTLVDGQSLPIRTELVEVAREDDSGGRNEVAVVGATTGIGAVIGAVAGGGAGAAIGAAIGAVAGTAGVLSTRGRPTEIYSEALLTFRLEDPVNVITEESRQAFLPVIQSDFNRSPRNPDRYPSARTYPPARARYYPYPYRRYVPYVGVYVGPPRYYVGPRIYLRPGHRRYW